MPIEPPSYPSVGRTPSATVIANGVRLEGDFSSQGDVVIEGEVHGNVSISGMLTVGSQARLKADVSADKAIISGSVDGNLTIGSHLDLKSTAKIHGDVQSETVAVESGATLDGKVTVGAKPRQVAISASSDTVSGDASAKGRNGKGGDAK